MSILIFVDDEILQKGKVFKSVDCIFDRFGICVDLALDLTNAILHMLIDGESLDARFDEKLDVVPDAAMEMVDT